MAENQFQRVVLLGASNIARGLHVIVETARNQWGPEIEIVAAQGHGRSYGAPTKMLMRSIPGIAGCGLFPALERMPTVPTLAVITDIGNDILFGRSPAQILDWIDDCAIRLRGSASTLIVTDLPIGNIRRISNAKFLFMRSILFPHSRQTLGAVIDASEEVSRGLSNLAAGRGLRFFSMREEWYGFDPIHVLRRHQRAAWREILCGENPRVPPALQRIGAREAAKLYFMRPEQRRIFGVDQFTPQSGFRSRNGGRIWLF